MKKVIIISLLVLISLYAKSQVIQRSFVIDSIIYKKHQGHMILLHRLGPNWWAGVHYSFRGLGHPQVAAGDTAVLVRNDPKHFHLPYITIKYKEHE